MEQVFGSAKTALLGSAQAARSALGNAAQTPYVLPFIAGIVAIVLVLIIVYVVIQYKSAHPAAQTKGPIDLWAPGSTPLVSRTDTKKSMSASWTLSFYVRFDAVPDMRSATPFLLWPGTWAIDYNPAQEELLWKVSPAPDGSFGATTQSIPIPNVPLQRWTQVTLCQEGRTIDMYVNGQLVKSDQLTNLPRSSAGSIVIAPGNIMGQAAYVQLWARRLTGSDIANNYADTSDSQGRPLLGPNLFVALQSLPNLFCGAGGCTGSSPSAQPSQTWEFPYA